MPITAERQHRDAAGLPDAADGLARGARRSARRRRAAKRLRRRAIELDGARAGRCGARARSIDATRRLRGGAAQQVREPDVRRALRAATSRRCVSTRAGGTERWRCCRSPSPAQSPDPHQRRHRRRHRPRHDPFARRRGAQRRRRVPARRARARSLLPSVVRYLADGRRRGRPRARSPARSTIPRNTIVSVKRLMGRGLADVPSTARCPTTSSDAPGMVALRDGGGRASRRSSLGRDPGDAARSAPRTRFDGELFGAVVTVPAYFDDAQRQATKDAAELAGPERAAPDQRADRGRASPTASTTAPRASTPSTTSAAAPSTSRSCA